MTRCLWTGLTVTLLWSGVVYAQYPDAELGDIGLVARLYIDDIVADGKNKRGVDVYVRAETRYGEPVETLRSVDLTISDNGDQVDSAKVELSSLMDLQQGVSAVVVLDRGSRTLGDEAFGRALIALEKVLEAARVQDSVAVVSFAEKASLVSPFGAPEAERRSAIAGLEASRGDSSSSSLYDAIHLAIEHIRSPDTAPRRGFVIVFTGGADEGSTRSLEELIELGRGNESQPRVPVFTVAYAGEGNDHATALQALSEGTAAKSFQATSPIHLPSLFQEIWRQMAHGYLVRYATDLDGAMHKIEISVEDQSDMRTVTYPDVGASLWGWGLGAAVVAAAGAFGYRMRSRNRLMGRLVFVGGQEAGREVALRGPDVRIGALPDNDIVVGSGAVSRKHAVLHLRGGVVEIEDLETRNGTFVNGTPVQSQPLQPGDKIRLADVDMVYEK